MYYNFLERFKDEYCNLNPAPIEIIDKYPDASDFDKCVLLL